jgi:DNA-binding beta-propeller fold protein YncE
LPVIALLAGTAFVFACGGGTAPATDDAQATADGPPSYIYDPSWPKALPNKWKMGGATGLAVDSNDDVWVYDRPNDLTAIELQAELTPPISDCCVRPPSMIHISKNGDVIGSFDAPQGHGMDVDADGFVYLGQETVRKYDPATGQVVGEIPRTPEREGGAPVGLPPWPPAREPGAGGRGPVAGFLPNPDGGRGADPAAAMARMKAAMAFRAKYPPETPMIVGSLEEIRIDEAANEIYVADNYLNGRILVFDKDTFEFKRGWGAYGKPLSEISTDDADHEYTPGGPMPRDFAGHLTLNFSRDGMVYAADRVANRIHVTDKQGNYQDKEFILAPMTGVGGSTGGVGFSPDPEQRYLYISDLTNNNIWFLERATGEVVGEFGSMGESGGQFFGLHMIAVDSTGNIYTGEVFAGERVQRFVPTSSPRGQLLQQLATLPVQ